MCIITSTELKRNFGKYNKLAELEEIIVTNHGREIYVIKPIKAKKVEDMESIFGLLPENATIGEDPNERG